MDLGPNPFFLQLIAIILTILGFGTALIGYNVKERSFWYYSIYAFLLLTFLLISDLYRYDKTYAVRYPHFFSFQWNLQVFYNAAYFLFYLNILDFKKHQPKIYKLILKIVYTIVIIGNIIFLLGIFNVINKWFFPRTYIYAIVPLLVILAIYTLIKTSELPGQLKYYFMFGGVFYIIFSIISLFFPLLKWNFFNLDSFDIFNIGILGEQIAFACGFAYKIKLMSLQIIKKSEENASIKERQNIVLQEKLKEKELEILTVTADAEEQRVQRLQTEHEDQINHLHLVSLQSQMNPHFIFNALNSIKSYLIDNDQQSAISFLTKFSKLIRNILMSSRVEKISLKEELDLVQIYVDIENLRFENQVQFQILNPDHIPLDAIFLPPMILQPFVENALGHGLLHKEGEKSLTLLFSLAENTKILKITDNGVGRKKAAYYSRGITFKNESVGLKITSERLEHFNNQYNVQYSYTISDLENEVGESLGTEVMVIFGEGQ